MDEIIGKIRESIGKAFFGTPSVIDRVLCCMLANGHLLLEDVPGVGKTLLASAAARSIGGEFKRVQMTADLLPSDLLGVSIFDQHADEFRFRPGPIFANVVIADEINRAPPRTQSALLEAMNEHSVTVDGVTHRLGQPFLVIATQNPADHHGAYPLPESQLDRFLIRSTVGYPEPETEIRIIANSGSDHRLDLITPVTTTDAMREIQDMTQATRLDPRLAAYIRTLAARTRDIPEVMTGLSTRGALAIARVARASARLAGRDYVTTDDIAGRFAEVVAHRLILGGGELSGTTESICRDVLRAVPMPV